MHKFSRHIVTVIFYFLSACSKENSSNSNSNAEQQTIEIKFKVRVGDDSFACGKSYAAIGSTASTIEARDFRFFLYQPELIASDGSRVPLTLSHDGVWQRDQVALLDFTDGTGLCDPAGPTTNQTIRGTVPKGSYSGFSFQFGLPPSLNHLDAATETAPMNQPGMWWTWKGGYKFARFDFKTTGQDTFYFHLGATSCTGNIEAGFSCAYDHEAKISFELLDPATQSIVLDLKTLFAESDMDTPANQAAGDFVKGCMAFAGDPECAAIFQKLGLTFSSKEVGLAQTAFRVLND